MKKILALLVICILLFTGCSKGEIESLNELNQSLSEDLSDKEEEITELEGEMEELESKISDAEGFVQTLSDENMELKKENKELLEEVESLQGPNKDSLMGYWMGNTYENQYFNITTSIPNDWNYLNDEDLINTIGLSLDYIDEFSDLNIESVEDETLIPLFLIFNSKSINGSTSNIYLNMTRQMVEYKLETIVEDAKPIWEQMFSQYGELSFENIEDVNIGGMDMIKQKIIIKMGTGDLFYADYLFFYTKGYLGSMSLTYYEGDEDPVYNILETFVFN